MGVYETQLLGSDKHSRVKVMAANWNLESTFEISYSGPRVEWIEEQVRYIIDRFDLQVDPNEITTMLCPSGRRREGGARMACTSIYGRRCLGGGFDIDGHLLLMSKGVFEQHTLLEVHYIIRHEVAHMHHKYDKPLHNDTSNDFLELLDMLDAPKSREASPRGGAENASLRAADAPNDVREFVEETAKALNM